MITDSGWEYRNLENHLLGYVCRFHTGGINSAGKPEKVFCPRVYTSEGWIWGGFPEPRPLYGLPRLAGASPDAVVLLVEGEGKADDLNEKLASDFAVLSLSGGSNAVAKHDFSPLHGRRLLYWQDADEPGAKAATQVCVMAEKAGVSSIKVIVPHEGAPKGWDAADAVKEGWDREKLLDYIKEQQVDPEAVSVSAGEQVDQDDRESGETKSRFLPPPPPVPLEAFPAEIRDLLKEAAEAFRVPLQIPAADLLAFLACLVGRSRIIRIKEGWEEAGNLWVLIVADSGMGKSPCMQAFFRAVLDLEREAERKFVSEFAYYEKACELYNAQQTAYIKGKIKNANSEEFTESKPKKPRLRQATIDDATSEAVANVLHENPKGISWFKDEFADFSCELDKYQRNGGAAKARLLSAHNS
jgi:hypothetical protein